MARPASVNERQCVAIRYAIVRGGYIRYDSRNGLLDAFETRESAERQCPPGCQVVRVEVNEAEVSNDPSSIS
jgi:hypothetical protein